MKMGRWAAAAGLAVAVLATAYAGACWYVGRQVEMALGAGYGELKRYGPYVAVERRVYERGIFSAREVVNVSISGPGVLRPPRKLVSFTIFSRIRHLPLSGWSVPSAASVDSTVNFAPGSLPERDVWTGGEDLARIHTDIALGGAVRTFVTIPAFDAPRLSSLPATLTIDFPQGLARYSMRGSAPRFALKGDRGERIQLKGTRFSGEHRRMLAGVPDIYAGTDRLTMETIEAYGPGGKALAAIGQASVEMSASPREGGEFMDTAIKYSLAQATVAGNSFGPAELEVAVRHLHTRAFASLSRIDARARGGDDKQKEKDADDLLLNQPEITGQLSFTVPEGDTLVTARAVLHDLKPADLADTGGDLRDKLEVTVDARTPAALVVDAHNRPLPLYEALARALDLPPDAAGLRRLIAGGYIARDGKYLRTRFLFRDGRYWLNGREFVPRPGASR